MASFSPEIIQQKLAKLSNSQESIETLSHWILFHKKHASVTISIWRDFILKVPLKQKLLGLFLVNDVVQKSKRKEMTVFVDGFAEILPNILGHVYSRADSSVKNQIERILNIWNERSIFDSSTLQIMRNTIGNLKETDNTPVLEESQKEESSLFHFNLDHLNVMNENIKNLKSSLLDDLSFLRLLNADPNLSTILNTDIELNSNDVHKDLKFALNALYKLQERFYSQLDHHSAFIEYIEKVKKDEQTICTDLSNNIQKLEKKIALLKQSN